jgi:hypothetical protein
VKSEESLAKIINKAGFLGRCVRGFEGDFVVLEWDFGMAEFRDGVISL